MLLALTICVGASCYRCNGASHFQRLVKKCYEDKLQELTTNPFEMIVKFGSVMLCFGNERVSELTGQKHSLSV